MRKMSNENEMTIAEGLSEIKRIVKLLPQRNENITEFCSKRKGTPDQIDKQQEYVRGQRQSAEDLIQRMVDIKLAIMRSNLDTYITWKDKTMSVAEAILFKSNVRGRLTSVKTLYERLYESFNTTTAQHQIHEYASLKGYHLGRVGEEEQEKLDLVPERYYDEREVRQQLEDLIELESMLDALIDSANHSTRITV
jgi:hypothetical protein